MTTVSFCERLFRAIFRAAVFLAIPLTTAFIMTGSAFKEANFIVTLIFLVLMGAFFVNGVIKYKRCVTLAVIVCALLFLALVRSVPEYIYSSKISDYLIITCADEQHIFSGYVSDGDASSSGGMYIELESVDERYLDEPVTVYTVNRSGHYYSQGEFLSVTAKIRKPVSYSEDFDFASWLISRGVRCELYDVSDIKADHTRAKSEFGSVIREFVYTNALKMINFTGGKHSFDRGTALAKALLWGDKSGFSDEELKDFSRSGMTHLLCVSGLHFSVVLGGVSVIIRLLVRKKTARKIVLGIICILYILLCGFSRSAMRAAVMAFVSVPDERNTSKSLVKLLVALSFICFISPDAILDTGFHLSVLSCGGIACSTHLTGIVRKKFDENPIALSLFDSASMALGAFSFTFAYYACAFGSISTVSVITSVLTVGAAEVCLIILWISVLFGTLNFKPLLFVCTGIYNRLAEYLYDTAEFFSDFSFASVPVNAPDISFSVFIVLMMVLASVVFSKVTATKIYFCALVLSVVSVVLLIQIS